MTEHVATGVRDAIAAVNDNFMAAVSRGDTAALAALYTEEGQLLPPSSDIVKGRQAIAAFWQAVMDMGIRGAKLETIEAERHGDVVVEIGTYALLGDAGTELDRGKYIVIWQKEDGAWKLHRDIFNTSMPASG